MHATLSFNGLLAGYPTLFDDLQVPASVSKDVVCTQLLFDTLELEVLYADGPTMQRALGVFSETMLPSWTRYAAALGLDYDVLASDDRTRTTDHHGTSGSTNTGKTWWRARPPAPLTLLPSAKTMAVTTRQGM